MNLFNTTANGITHPQNISSDKNEASINAVRGVMMLEVITPTTKPVLRSVIAPASQMTPNEIHPQTDTFI